MNFFKAQNIFDANKINFYIGKLISFHFVSWTVTKRGFCEAFTSKWDFCRFLLAMFFCLWVAGDAMNSNLIKTSRSLVFDIGTYFNAVVEAVHPCISILQIYFFRAEYLKILQNIYWIDNKVKKIDVYYLGIDF